MNQQDSINCIILCGGKGSRMNSDKTHKVCFEINGIPAIHRLMDNLTEAGVGRFIAVVGSRAGDVVECIGKKYDGVIYAYQRTPLGTGDAASKGIEIIRRMKISGPVLIVMGDKIIDPDILKRSMDKFFQTGADALVTVQPKEFNPSGGRIVLYEDGRIRGICEQADIQKALLHKTSHVSKENSVETQRDEDEYVRLGGELLEPEEVEASSYVNAAVYMFKQEALNQVLGRGDTHNAQGELYLTQMINLLAAKQQGSEASYRVEMMAAERRHQIMSFNNVKELLDIENFYLEQQGMMRNAIPFSMLKPVEEWLSLFHRMPDDFKGIFTSIYGDDPGLIGERRQAYIAALEKFKERYGASRQVIISRAPGRVNLMGRHVEHRGGFVNVVSINKEIIAVASPREDDLICLTNTDSEFEDRKFIISQHLSELKWQEWTDFIDSRETQEMVLASKGDWMNYVKAAVLRLQYRFKDRRLKGMDMAFHGNIPKAAGLSSSSAMVVATAEAAVVVNGLDVTPQRFVDLCGEGEWFVGSRGGAGDHAAMKFGSRGYIAHLGFFPFGFQGATKFPENYQLVIANSYMKAQKTTNAKDLFNQRIASYELALMLFYEKFPQYRHLVHHIRDIHPENLKIPPSGIYQMLLEIPDEVKSDEIFSTFPGKYHEKIRNIMNSHTTPESYSIRPVLLYGIAECQRSRICRRLLAEEDFHTFGRLMAVSHDGDRIGQKNVTNEDLRKLIEDLKSEDPKRVYDAQIEMQPGGYACSTAEIDFMVDVARKVPGVIGAQLSGAGLGGCIMVLVERNRTNDLIEALDEAYYRPRGYEPGMTVCIPVKGSMVWEYQS